MWKQRIYRSGNSNVLTIPRPIARTYQAEGIKELEVRWDGRNMVVYPVGDEKNLPPSLRSAIRRFVGEG